MVLPSSLLVAVDGSEHATAAASFAGTIAGKLGASVLVATVVPQRLVMAPAWIEMMSQMEAGWAAEFEVAMDRAREIAEAAAGLITGRGVESVQWTVEVGDPAEAIVSLAQRYDTEVIVMGRRGTGNITGLLLGSVSTKVSQRTDLTLATVRTADREDLERILVAVDGSEHSDRAVEFAAELAAACDASLTILTVAANPMGPILIAPYGQAGTWAAGREGLVDAGWQVVAAAERLALKGGPIDLTAVVETGHPASSIVDHATRIGADVICIGRRGLGNVKGLLLGSVSHAVGHLASQTVITVR